ncbi:MAG: M67 family metallopeptidase [Oscillospiraceae bacterium]|jgi:proteasome lid subunit RPN8/RPN11|nr:M67 family metallopeptidase [Oscillospiraceae bacterium]
MTIRIRQADCDAMAAHARAALPNEACGLIAGRQDGALQYIEKVYLLTNTDQSRTHFSIDPREHLAAVKDMRAHGLSPLGNFHSHPETPARPSQEDIRLAHDPKATYLILSLAESPPVLHAFHIENAAASPLRLEISPYTDER